MELSDESKYLQKFIQQAPKIWRVESCIVNGTLLLRGLLSRCLGLDRIIPESSCCSTEDSTCHLYDMYTA